MIETRSHSCSTSERMWLESSTVAPAARTRAISLRNIDLHERVEPAGGLVEDVEVGRHGECRDQRDLLPVALGVRAALLARVELERLHEARLLARYAGSCRDAPRRRESRSIASPPERFGQTLTSPGT